MSASRALAAACRWTGRVIGTLLVASTVVIAIGEGMPNPLTQPAWVQLMFFALALILVGILIGWRWELAGGMISLAGFFLGVVLLNNSRRGLTSFYFALALPGVLYVMSALLRRQIQRPPSA